MAPGNMCLPATRGAFPFSVSSRDPACHPLYEDHIIEIFRFSSFHGKHTQLLALIGSILSCSCSSELEATWCKDLLQGLTIEVRLNDFQSPTQLDGMQVFEGILGAGQQAQECPLLRSRLRLLHHLAYICNPNLIPLDFSKIARTLNL